MNAYQKQLQNFYTKNPHDFFLTVILFGLLVIRVSIDYLGLFISIPVPILGTLSLSQAFALIVLPLMGFFFSVHYRDVLRTPFIASFIAMIFLAIITIPITPLSNLTLALYEAIRITTIIFVYALAYKLIDTPQRFHILVWIVLLASTIPAIFALYQFIIGVGYSDVAFNTLRIFGSFTHPNVYGTYLLVTIATALIGLVILPAQSAHYFNRERMLLTIILIVEFSLVMLTFTRIAWLMALFIIGSFLLIKKRILIIPLIVIFTIAYLTLPQIHDRILEARTLSPDSSLIWRINLWHDTILYTFDKERVLFGNGTGTFMDFAEGIRGSLFGDLEPHNEFVRAFVENGFIGLGIYIFYLITFSVALFTRIIRTPSVHGRNVFFVLGILFVALAFASLSDHIFRSTPLQWTMMALIGGALATYATRYKK